MARTVEKISFVALLALLAIAWGCDDEADAGGGDAGSYRGDAGTNRGDAGPFPGDAGTDEPPFPGYFESDVMMDMSFAGAGGTGGGTGGSGGSDTVPVNTLDAERIITEADLIQIRDDRLYALSSSGGLGVVDITQRDQPRLLGRYEKTNRASPFEMYLRDGVALVMFSGWSQYENEEGASSSYPKPTSKLLALDASDPENIQLLDAFDIRGTINDSRLVGDVLYVVSHEAGQCWDCDPNRPQTSVVSLNVADPRRVEEIDMLSYADDNNLWGWNTRSISVTSERVYVTGPEYDGDELVGSTIQVVDISDPTGRMVEGARVAAQGQVSSRWQMDEYESVLRIVSQPPAWNHTLPPVVQTFEVVSSQQLDPLGSIELVMPGVEELKSVRFDGPLAYAITFPVPNPDLPDPSESRADPLFVIDLSDPAQPRQRGELEMPGWVYHMEPLEDRLLGLGFDDGASEGPIAVSLFDVSDLDQPTMLSRVSFGGSQGQRVELAEQDRVHKAFRLLEDIGLLLVPYAAWSRNDDDSCELMQSGVQLVDFSADSLALRGSVGSPGEARRSFVHDTRMFVVNEGSVAVYDIDDRDAPALTADVQLGRSVDLMADLGNGVVGRLSLDDLALRMSLDLVELSDVDSIQPGTELELAPSRTDLYCRAAQTVDGATTDASRLLLLLRTSNTNPLQPLPGQIDLRQLVLVEASDPASPAVLFEENAPAISGGLSNLKSWERLANASPIAINGDAMAVMERTASYPEPSFGLRVTDISDPRNPRHHDLDLPEGLHHHGLFVSGTTVAAGHYELVEDRLDRARHFLDRFDISDPAAPRALEPVNVPGAPLYYDDENKLAVSVELQRGEPLNGVDWSECPERFALAEYQYETYTCVRYTQTYNLVQVQGDEAVVLDSYRVNEDRLAYSAFAGDGVLFVSLASSWVGQNECENRTSGYVPAELLVLDGIDRGAFEVGHLSIPDTADSYLRCRLPVRLAIGRKVLLAGLSELAVVDANDLDNMVVAHTEPLFGYLEHAGAAGNSALLSLGAQGVRVVDLGP
jgi:hypothetical protein